MAIRTIKIQDHFKLKQGPVNPGDSVPDEVDEENVELVHSHEISAILTEPFIHSGYRPPYKSRLYYLRSFFQLHNESVNVWSHFLSALIVLYNLAAFLLTEANWNDSHYLVVIMLAMGGFETSFFSSIAHLLHAQSEYYHFRYFQLDYLGLTLTFQTVGLYYTFFLASDTFYAWNGEFYLAIALVVMCFTSFALLVVGKLYLPPDSKHRLVINIVLGVTLGVLAGIPGFFRIYEIFDRGHWRNLMTEVLPHVLDYVLLICGAIFYGKRIPERFWPGSFDFFGHGHQIFHIFLGMLYVYQIVRARALYVLRSQNKSFFNWKPKWGAEATFLNTVFPHVCLLIMQLLFIVSVDDMTKMIADHQKRQKGKAA